MPKPSGTHPSIADREPSCPACAMTALRSPTTLYEGWRVFTRRVERLASVVPPLLLRSVLAYEFWEAGWMKLHGENWFQDLSFPFSRLPADVNWTLATSFELVGPVALVLGLGTQFFSLALMVLTWVAIASVHWPAEWHSWSELRQGYAITDQGYGNYQLPVLYLVMFLPLLFGGAGTLSLDAWWAKRRTLKARCNRSTASACSAAQEFHVRLTTRDMIGCRPSLKQDAARGILTREVQETPCPPH